MQLQELTIGGKRPALGSFGKATRGSVALNYGRSGGANCSSSCPYHPESTSPHAEPSRARCYAAAGESRPDRKPLAAKLDRHESAGGDAVTFAADAELRGYRYRLPWFRLSAFGSVPPVPPRGFRDMIGNLCDAGTPIHFPIECNDKAERYRRELDGLPVAVRVSVASFDEFIAHSGPCSFVAGSMEDRPRTRVSEAKTVAAERTAETGRPCKVCPAAAATLLRTGSKNAKCGACTVCSDPAADVVYPVHR